MMVKREVIEKAGSMPECYFLYYEELDWSMRIRHAGYDIWYDPSCTIYHKESRTTGQSSPLRTYYMTRNRFLFARRNVKVPKRYLTYCYLITMVAVRDIINHLFTKQFRLIRPTILAIADFSKKRFGYKEFKDK